MAMDLMGTVTNIVTVALQIKNMVDTVQQNKEDCKNIAKRVKMLREIVEDIGNTDVSSKPTMSDALNSLHETLQRALALVEACKTKNCVWLFITAGNISKQLREVNNEIMFITHIILLKQTVRFPGGYIKDTAAKSKGFLPVLSLDVHPNEPWIMTSHHEGKILIWNYETDVTNAFEVGKKTVCTAKFIARKDWFVAGDRAGFMYVYNYDTMHNVARYRAGGTHITSVAIHPTEPYVLSSSNDHLIKLWDWENGWQCIRTFQGHTDIVWQVAFNPKNSNSFASISDDGHVKIWSILSNNSTSCEDSIDLFSAENKKVDLFSVDYFTCGDQQYLITGTFEGYAYVWDLQTRELVDTLQGHEGCVSVVCSHEDMPILFSGSFDGIVRQWKSTTTNTFRLSDVIVHRGIGEVHALICLKGSTSLVIGGEDGLSLIDLAIKG